MSDCCGSSGDAQNRKSTRGLRAYYIVTSVVSTTSKVNNHMVLWPRTATLFTAKRESFVPCTQSDCTAPVGWIHASDNKGVTGQQFSRGLGNEFTRARPCEISSNGNKWKRVPKTKSNHPQLLQQPQQCAPCQGNLLKSSDSNYHPTAPTLDSTTPECIVAHLPPSEAHSGSRLRNSCALLVL